MRFKLWMAASVGAAGLLFNTPVAEANLALQLNPNACISSLSAQLLSKPRSQAGNKKNTWDADPPLPAENGFHYFVYNLDPNNNPLPLSQQVITLQTVLFGPGYTGHVEALARIPGQPGPAVFIEQDPQNLTFNFDGLDELGLARITFNRLQQSETGQIVEADDVEIDYDAKDINGNFSNERGVEHVRLGTEYLDGTPAFDALVARGMMTTIVPSAFNVFSPGGAGFPQGFLDFGNGLISSGTNVFPAVVETPEPASLMALGFVGIMLRRRR